MDLTSISPLILTFNEEPNLARVLEKLSWARRIVVVDSFSTDRTLEILHSFPNVEVFQHPFESFAAQCNFGLTQIRADWVLSLDADYVCTDALIDEIAALAERPSPVGFRVAFRYCIDGQPLRGSLYPPRVVLYRHGAGRYVDDGHAHRVEIEGLVSNLSSVIHHDDRKGFDVWLASQQRYTKHEVQKLLTTPKASLSWPDKLRRTGWAAPVVMPMYCLFAKGLVMDGRRGFIYTLQRTLAELLLALRLHDVEVGDAMARNKHKSAPPAEPRKSGV